MICIEAECLFFTDGKCTNKEVKVHLKDPNSCDYGRWECLICHKKVGINYIKCPYCGYCYNCY
jgi:hypothetical protein